MSTAPRTPLAQISGNRKLNTELTLYERGIIIGLSSAGQSHRQIGTQLDVPHTTVQTTIEHQKPRPDGLSKTRPGRPPQFTPREIRVMLLCVRIHPKMIFIERRTHCDSKISNSYIKNLCREAGLSQWRAKKRPELSEEHAKLRYFWCLCRAH